MRTLIELLGLAGVFAAALWKTASTFMAVGKADQRRDDEEEFNAKAAAFLPQLRAERLMSGNSAQRRSMRRKLQRIVKLGSA